MKTKFVKRLAAVLLTALMLAASLVPSLAVTKTAAAGSYQNVTTEYIAINQFRLTPGVWQWNSDNRTVTMYNTTLFNILPVLQYNAALEKTAKVRAKEIVQKFSHTRPNGTRCFTAYPSMSYLGENIAYGQQSVTEVMEAFKETNLKYAGQGHRRNMLNPNFNAVGFACYKVNGICYWVQCFGRV